jgi:hypothetical protein
MSKKRPIILQLADKTKIYANDFRMRGENFVLKEPKWLRQDDRLIGLLESSAFIHKDAIEVYFVCHRGGLYGKS